MPLLGPGGDSFLRHDPAYCVPERGEVSDSPSTRFAPSFPKRSAADFRVVKRGVQSVRVTARPLTLEQSTLSARDRRKRIDGDQTPPDRQLGAASTGPFGRSSIPISVRLLATGWSEPLLNFAQTTDLSRGRGFWRGDSNPEPACIAGAPAQHARARHAGAAKPGLIGFCMRRRQA